VGEVEFIHLKIYKALPHTGKAPEITDLSEGHLADDPL
jgi:hypothetical protein